MSSRPNDSRAKGQFPGKVARNVGEDAGSKATDQQYCFAVLNLFGKLFQNQRLVLQIHPSGLRVAETTLHRRHPFRLRFGPVKYSAS